MDALISAVRAAFSTSRGGFGQLLPTSLRRRARDVVIAMSEMSAPNDAMMVYIVTDTDSSVTDVARQQ